MSQPNLKLEDFFFLEILWVLVQGSEVHTFELCLYFLLACIHFMGYDTRSSRWNIGFSGFLDQFAGHENIEPPSNFMSRGNHVP